ncbi:MAG TPA: hypothetical protein VD929_06445 [Caulobacteraceae bacterium]|nr:hypothetical protein [Caulobacteraceae bacterium]
MAFICYIYPPIGRVPYMEVLDHATLEQAADHARRLLRDRPDCDLAELYEDDRPVAKIGRDEIAA